jgi:hypothetical protein
MPRSGDDIETIRDNLTKGQGKYHYHDDSLAALDRLEAELKYWRVRADDAETLSREFEDKAADLLAALE